jgi:enamine deaminase RidA (YjgF/YER057c/UK114 family)
MTTTAYRNEAGAPGSGQGSLRIVMPRVLDDAAQAQVMMIASRTKQCRVLFLSAEGDPSAGGVEEQCRDIYARLAERLKASGSSLDAVVKTTEFVTPEGLAAYRRTADVRRDVFATPYPAATGVVCERLLHPEARIAVEVVAVRHVA